MTSYQAFREENVKNMQILNELHENIKNVMPFKVTLANISNIGTIMKLYYYFYCDEDVKNAISYSFGFNSYVEHISGLKMLVINKKMAPCAFLNSSLKNKSKNKKKLYFKSSYY